jgi:hypothetical protein
MKEPLPPSYVNIPVSVAYAEADARPHAGETGRAAHSTGT